MRSTVAAEPSRAAKRDWPNELLERRSTIRLRLPPGSTPDVSATPIAPLPLPPVFCLTKYSVRTIRRRAALR
jgi:hypothetical protein